MRCQTCKYEDRGSDVAPCADCNVVTGEVRGASSWAARPAAGLCELWCDVVRAKRITSGVTVADLAERLGWENSEVINAENDCRKLSDAKRSDYIDALDGLAREGACDERPEQR